jgi:hypothetical protein
MKKIAEMKKKGMKMPQIKVLWPLCCVCVHVEFVAAALHKLRSGSAGN